MINRTTGVRSGGGERAASEKVPGSLVHHAAISSGAILNVEGDGGDKLLAWWGLGGYNSCLTVAKRRYRVVRCFFRGCNGRRYCRTGWVA